jgi:hypothetical protein
MTPDQLAKSALKNTGQGNFVSSGNQSNRIVYPARVINSNDPLGMNRIQARIVTTEENNSTERRSQKKGKGGTNSGRDGNKLDGNLVWCIPMLPEHIHLRPQAEQKDADGNVIVEGEMVFVILDNPSDNSSMRYWVGPIRKTQLNLKYESFSSAKRIYNITNASTEKIPSQDPKLAAVLPGEGDIAIQGKDDSDLILRQREVFLVAGKFVAGSTSKNEVSPSSLQLKQFSIQDDNDNTISYSQANLTSTNINLFSPDGKFRGPNAQAAEIALDSNGNDLLERWGELADSLHPSVYGDELLNLLDLMIRIILNHIHTPQESLVPTDDSRLLSQFTLDGRLQEIISNHVRIN